MKFLVLFLLMFIYIHPQDYPVNNFSPTNENIAKPDEVLVVYKDTTQDYLDTMSIHIKNYYISKRGIPGVNSLGLNLKESITIDGHLIELILNGEVIYDQNWQEINTNHAWRYFKTYIMDPIQNYLDTTYVSGVSLRNTIKYIVLCKGMPLKINPYVEYSGNNQDSRKMVCADGLLCFLSQNDPNFSILNLFGTTYDQIGNPYFYVDKTFQCTYRFKSNYFGDSNYKINYLVSRLDGFKYNDVIDLIDRASTPDLSGNNLFLLDAHYTYGPGVYSLRSDASRAHINLNNIGYNDSLDLSDNLIYSASMPVIGYTSSGKHAGMPVNYNYLFTFDKPAGAIYNTYESYNGFYMDTLNLWNRQDNQGMLTEWVRVGGTGGAGHTYEPTAETISKDSIYFPLYAVGYSMVDAVFQGIPYLAYQNVIVGDPLTTVAWGKQNITYNKEMSDTNLVIDTLNIDIGDTLIVRSGSFIKLQRYGFITGLGRLIVESNVTFTSESWARSLLLAAENNHPKLVWTNINIITPITRYLIYKKYGSGSWSQITSTSSRTWVDTTVNFATLFGTSVQYKIKAANDSEESDYSNTVNTSVTRAKEMAEESLNNFSYTLEQNYPNPFNPTTSIKYVVAEDGFVTLKVYDILGNEVATLVNESQYQGSYGVMFNASSLSSGVYIYRLKSNNFTSSRKMIILK